MRAHCSNGIRRSYVTYAVCSNPTPRMDDARPLGHETRMQRTGRRGGGVGSLLCTPSCVFFATLCTGCNILFRHMWRFRRCIDLEARQVIFEVMDDSGDNGIPRKIVMRNAPICRGIIRCQFCGWCYEPAYAGRDLLKVVDAHRRWVGYPRGDGRTTDQCN